jgi:hypothetical protein
MKRTSVKDLISVRTLEIVDEHGSVKGAFGVDEQGNARFFMGDIANDQGIQIEANDSGFSSISLSSKYGYSSLQLVNTPDHNPGIKIMDADNHCRAYIGFVFDTVSMFLADSQGRVRIASRLPAEGEPCIAVIDDEGYEIDAIGGDDDEDIIEFLPD